MTQYELRDVLSELSLPNFHPEIGKTTIYYIGNIWYGPYLDDRSWAVSLDDWRVPGNQHHHAPHNLNIGGTEDLEALTEISLAYSLGRQVGIAAKAYREHYGKRSPFIDAA